jgi:hypothetical protein
MASLANKVGIVTGSMLAAAAQPDPMLRSLARWIGSQLNPAATPGTATKLPTKSTSGCRRLCSATNEYSSHLPDAALRCHPAPCVQREVAE